MLLEAWAGRGGSRLLSQHFGRLVDHLRSGVQDQPDQNGETPSLFKKKKKKKDVGDKCPFAIAPEKKLKLKK